MHHESETKQRSWRRAGGMIGICVFSSLIGASLVVAIDQIPRESVESKAESKIVRVDSAIDHAASVQQSRNRRAPESSDDWMKQRIGVEYRTDTEWSHQVARLPESRFFLLNELNSGNWNRMTEYWIVPGELPVLIGEIRSSKDATDKPESLDQNDS